MYCPKCGSRLYPNDEEPMRYAGVCGACVDWDRTPDRRYQKALDEGRKAVAKVAKKQRKSGGRAYPLHHLWG